MKRMKRLYTVYGMPAKPIIVFIDMFFIVIIIQLSILNLAASYCSYSLQERTLHHFQSRQCSQTLFMAGFGKLKSDLHYFNFVAHLNSLTGVLNT